MAAVQMGLLAGAKVIAAASSEEKLDVCRAMGVAATINYSTENLREAIKALTDGKGPDVIYDPVGGDLTEQAFRSIAWRGRGSSGRAAAKRCSTCSAHAAAHRASSWWSVSESVPPRRIVIRRGSRSFGRIMATPPYTVLPVPYALGFAID